VISLCCLTEPQWNQNFVAIFQIQKHRQQDYVKKLNGIFYLFFLEIKYKCNRDFVEGKFAKKKRYFRGVREGEGVGLGTIGR